MLIATSSFISLRETECDINGMSETDGDSERETFLELERFARSTFGIKGDVFASSFIGESQPIHFK